MKMASRYKFSKEEISAIEQRRKGNKDKRAEVRLKALELRAKGANAKEVAEATGFHAAYVTQLVAKYREYGLEAISGNHYGGNHRNMSAEEEMAILAPFKARAEARERVEINFRDNRDFGGGAAVYAGDIVTTVEKEQEMR